MISRKVLRCLILIAEEAFGTAEFVVQYIIERLNVGGHTINILCANKNERKNESKCTARLTLKAKEEIWPFFTKTKVKNILTGPFYAKNT